MNKDKVIKVLSEIFNLEINGVVRYTHYALMIVGSDRLPLVTYFRGQATESLAHADLAGEHITGLGGHPPLNNDNLKETFKFAGLQTGSNFIPVLVSGGVGTINDVVAVKVKRDSDPRIEGLIIGKAIYDGRMPHDQLVRLTDLN